jgi:signal transduction histidine kinase
MFRKAFSIPRTRLATQLTLFVVFAVLFTIITTYLVVLRAEQAFEYKKAERRAETLLPALTNGLDIIDGVAWVLPPRAEVSASPPAELSDLPPGHHLLQRRDGPVHAVVRPMPEDRRAIVLYASAPHLEQRGVLLRLLVGAAMVLVAATVALAPWWAGFMLRHDPVVRRRIGQQMQDATREAFRTEEVASSTLARTYTEYVRLLYDPQERSREFIANVAHELRTPLMLVRSGCEVINTTPEISERHGRRLGQMISALDHMDETVGSFLLLARDGDYGAAASVRVGDIFADLVALHAPEAVGHKVEIVVGTCDDTPVVAQREALRIVVSNLLRNAIRHGARPGRITLVYSSGRITVSDDGPGISDEDRQRIFLPFFRSRRAAEEGTFGLGLGLAIVQRVCETCGWEIDVTSQSDGGTNFSVTIKRH